MQISKLISIPMIALSLSCRAESTPTSSLPDASTPQPPPTGPCRDTATIALDGTTVTCHPEADAVIDFAPVTGRPVVVCSCRRAEPCDCDALLDWQEPEPPRAPSRSSRSSP